MLEQLFAGPIPIGLSCLVAAISIMYRARQAKVVHTLHVLKFAQAISVSAWGLFYLCLALGWHPNLSLEFIMARSFGALFLNLIAVENFNGRIDAAIERFLSRCRLKP